MDPDESFNNEDAHPCREYKLEFLKGKGRKE